MADALDINAVNDIVRWAVQSINVNEQGQTLTIQGTVQQQQQQQQPQPQPQPQPQGLLTSRHVQQFVNLLQEHPRAVGSLFIESFDVTVRAVEILRSYFSTSSLRHVRFNRVYLGNENIWRRLLSGLHGNTSVIQLDLFRVDLEGRAGGEVISTLLQHNNSRLAELYCSNLPLGVEGARAMQPGLRGNHTVQALGLDHCQLGNDGVSLIADGLHENTTMNFLGLGGNGINANGLHHVTPLLQSLLAINFDVDPGILDNQENTRVFSSALQNSHRVQIVSLNFCQLPGHAMVALFEALSTKTELGVYDNVQLQGADLENVLEIIPQMRNLRNLRINLDFMDRSVLSSFRRNTSIQHLYTWNGTSTIGHYQEVTTGPVFDIMTRNRLLCHASMLLDSEPRWWTVPLGLWSKAIERLTRSDNNTGATAVYKIMREKLIMWWPPQHQTTTAAVASMTNAPPAIAHSSVASTSVAAIAASNSSSTTTGGGERSSAQDDDDDDSTNDNMKTSSSSTSTPTSLEPPANKRPRQS